MPKKNILLDLGKLKDLNCGLGQVSLNYAHEVEKDSKSSFVYHFFLPKGVDDSLFNSPNIRKHYINDLGRYVPVFNPKVDLWHALHQDSDFFPAKGIPYSTS